MHEAFTAGLLHDVGKLVMAEALPGYNVIVAEAPPQRDLADVERHEFGASHAEVGAYLFGLWGLPYGIVEAVAWHHRPAESGVAEPCPLTCVHAANVIDRQLAGAAQATVAMDDNYLASLGLAEASRGWYHLAPASAGDGPAAA